MRVSLGVAALAIIVAVTAGSLVGLVAGYYGGWADGVLMRIVDIMLSIPVLFLLLFITTLWRVGRVLLAGVIAAVSWVTLSRLVRGEVLAVKNREYVEAARVIGVGDFRVIWRHILPERCSSHDRLGIVDDSSPDSGRSLVELSRAGRPASDSILGQHAVRGSFVLGPFRSPGHPARSGDLHHRLRDQSDGQRPSRRARSTSDRLEDLRSMTGSMPSFRRSRFPSARGQPIRRDGVALVMIVGMIAVLVVAWVDAADYLRHERPFGDEIPGAFDDGQREFGNEGWWPSVRAFYSKVHALQIETTLDGDAFATCNAIYERIWSNSGQFSRWMIGKLFVYDQNDQILCGGAA